MCNKSSSGPCPDAAALPAATAAVIAHYFGARGVFACQAFTYLNAAYFAGTLPQPLLLRALTPHGACLGATHADRVAPIITLHPSLLGGSGRANPWRIEPRWLGPAFACDVLMHECLHLAVHLNYGGPSGPTSHNSPEWVTEVNRVAPLLGFPEFVAAVSAPRRVPAPGAGTGDGRRPMVVERRSATAFGDTPLGFRVVAGFPYALRIALGRTGPYETNALPFAHVLDDRSG